MKTLSLNLIFLLSINFLFGQHDTIQLKTKYQTQITNTWESECYDNYGRPLNTQNDIYRAFTVNEFKTKTPIDINIKSIKLDSQTININIHYQENIEYETKIINLNDTTGLKVTIAKTVDNGYKTYLYRLEIFKKVNESNCWRSTSLPTSFFNVYSQTTSLNLFSLDNIDKGEYFQIIEGSIKFE